jgi:glycogen(starch) synthase
MNILVFSTVFYPAIGGIENQTLILIEEFVKRGHNVKVLTYQNEKAELPGIEICYAPDYKKFIKLYIWCDTFYMPNISLKGIWLRFFNPHKQWVISHNDFHFTNKKDIISRLKYFFSHRATKNISVSQSVANKLRVKSTVIQNCYDESVFKLYPEEQRQYDFVFLGRLVTQKGCAMLLRSCKALNRPFTLGIIGIGTEKARLEKMVEDFGLSGYVTFHGLLKDENLARTLNQYRAMVIPSVKGEGFGMVALEGMACGCKILAANAEGLSDAVREFGEKFEMRDENKLAQLLHGVLDDNEKEEALISSELGNYLKMHHKDEVAKQYLEVFA